jgi:hypothetical protein
MNVKRNRKKTNHTGSTFDVFLEEEGDTQGSRGGRYQTDASLANRTDLAGTEEDEAKDGDAASGAVTAPCKIFFNSKFDRASR